MVRGQEESPRKDFDQNLVLLYDDTILITTEEQLFDIGGNLS